MVVASPTSSTTLRTVPALSATKTRPLLVGSRVMARSLLGSFSGFPWLFLDLRALRLVSSIELLLGSAKDVEA